MLEEIHSSHVADEWAKRSEYWSKKSLDSAPKRPKRQRCQHPLILCGHGISMRIDRGTLFVRDGFTHYPQTQTELRFFPGDLEIPERIIIVDGSGGLSLAVLDWLNDQGVTLIRVNWNGKAVIGVGGNGSFIDPEKLLRQFESARSDTAKIAFAAKILERKLTASMLTLETCFTSEQNEKALGFFDKYLKRLQRDGLRKFDELYAIEGPCAQTYFRTWQHLKLYWKACPSDLIPPAWTEFDARSSPLTGAKPANWKAIHPINAMLNYGYAVLEAEVRIACIKQGYDPRIGIMHRSSRGSPDPFVFDVMEPYRPVVDAAVLQFALNEKFSPKDFVLKSNGVCRLSQQMAKVLAGHVTRHIEGLQVGV